MGASGFRHEEDYRPHPKLEGVMMSFLALEVTQTGDDKIEFYAEDGDKGGMGAEHRAVAVEVPFEDCRRLMEFLHPILYGELEEAERLKYRIRAQEAEDRAFDAEKERDHWKQNHDEAVRRKQVAFEKGREAAIEELLSEECYTEVANRKPGVYATIQDAVNWLRSRKEKS